MLENVRGFLQVFIFFEETITNIVLHERLVGSIIEYGWWYALNANIFDAPLRKTIISLWIRFTVHIDFTFCKSERVKVNH